MRIRMCLALALATVALSSTHAGTNRWTDLGPDGGGVSKVVFHPTAVDTLWAVTNGGIYRSQDAGGSWHRLTEGTTLDLEIDRAHPDRIYRAAASHLLLSNDGGTTFAPLAGYFSTGADQVEVSADGMTIYTAFGRHIYRSTDGGATWTEGASVPTAAAGGGVAGVKQLLIDPASAEAVYVLASTSASTQSLFLSEDGAANWQLVQTYTLNVNDVVQLAASSSPRRLWSAGASDVLVSSDRGRHFSSTNLGGDLLSVAVDSTNANRVYVGGADGSVFRSEDAGSSWVDVTGDLLGIALPIGLFINSARPAEVYAAGTAGLARTTSSGLTWLLRQAGISATRIDAFSADPASDRIYFRSSAHGVHYVESGASRAVQLNISALRSAIQLPRFAYVGALHAQVGTPGRLFVKSGIDFLRSLDGGDSWEHLTFPVFGYNDITSITSAPDAPDTLVASTGFDGAFRSIDGGSHWLADSTGFPTNVLLRQVEVARSDPHVVYAVPLQTAPGGGGTAGLGVYRWTDAASKWEPANIGIADEYVSQLAVDPSDAQVVYAAGNHGLWKTVNGGAAWVQLQWSNSPAAFTVAIDPIDPRIIYAAGGGLPRRSVDGTTWESLDDPNRTPGPAPFTMIVDPKSPDTVLAGTASSGVQSFTVAPDLAIEAGTPSGPASAGSTLVYQFVAQNLGPFASTDTRIRLQLPVGTRDISAEPATSCVVSGVTVSCALGVLRTDLSSAVTLHASPAASGQFAVTASVAARQSDPVATNNSVTVTSTITAPSSDTSGDGGGSGGGGALSAYWLLVLAVLVAMRASHNAALCLCEPRNTGVSASCTGRCSPLS